MNQEWQSIETAPKDGTPIIAGRWLYGYFIVRSIAYSKISKKWVDYPKASYVLDVSRYTHWINMPAPPKEPAK